MLAPVKNVDLKITKAQADWLRQKVRKSLQKAESLRLNNTREELTIETKYKYFIYSVL